MKGKEAQLQYNCLKWFGYQYPELAPLMIHIPNGGSRNPIEAANLKKQGVKAGVPDLFFASARGGYYGLFIEMKWGKNKLTPKQKFYMEILTKGGFQCAICYDFDSFVTIISEYLFG